MLQLDNPWVFRIMRPLLMLQNNTHHMNALQSTHPSIIQVPVVVTDCAPQPIILDLHPALVWCVPIY